MAPSPQHVAGSVLEEAILAVLEHAGFATLTHLGGDITINERAPPVTIYGRGASHQIDAVADPIVAHPFSNPTRLLIEAKAYHPGSRVGLGIVRNAVGTLKDLSEFWRPADLAQGAMRRYHYRYAIFATTQFTKPAQEYAYAHDLHLLPLRRSAFFRPIVAAIDQLRTALEAGRDLWPRGRSLSSYRQRLREALRNRRNVDARELVPVVEAVASVRAGLIAMVERQFPLFLVPRRIAILDTLRDVERVRIFWDPAGWYLRRSGDSENLFSFDLPDELFALYANGGGLRQEAALRLKVERLAAIQAFYVRSGSTRLVQFQLDHGWIELLRDGGGRRKNGSGT